MRLSMLRDFLDSGVEHRGVAEPHPLQGLRLGRRTDVDPQVRDLRDFVCVLLLHQMDRLLADHPAHRAARTRDDHPLADEHLGIPAPDAGEVEVPVVVHVRDLEADLVDVPREHQPRCTVGVERGHGVAVHIGRHLIGKSLHLVAPHTSGRGFEARGPRRIEQPLQKVERVWRHGLRNDERGRPSRRRTLSAAAPVATLG